MADQQWTIAPLVLGTAVRDVSECILHAPIGTPMPGAIIAWFLTDGQEKVLVDTGLGETDTPDVKERFTLADDNRIESQLGRFDTKPSEIKLVINTHLHVDHCGGNALFREARFFVQKREMDYALNPLPVHRPAYDVNLSAVEFEFLDGDSRIASGIEVITTPGHSPGSQSVLVNTARGRYIIVGDTITHFRQIEVPDGQPFLPGPLYTDLVALYDSFDRLKATGAAILPGHDPLVLKRKTYPW